MTVIKPNEKENFLKVFDHLNKEVLDNLESYNLPKDGKVHIKELIQATVPNGKMNRGMTVLSSYASLVNRDLNAEEIFKANTLGWCVEWLQAFFLVADDIMDGSITRRGQPCWYRRESVGLNAINDSFILESFIYKILKTHFRTETYYVDLIELFHEVSFQTELGQLMDLITAPEDKVDLNRFSTLKHAYIVQYKTAYYSFYLPIALSMLMAGIKNPKAYRDAQDILLPLGEYFQVQDDYLDCYGDPEVIGKIGTDIMDNKCSWLINQALILCSSEQKKILEENYGKKTSANELKVKKVFEEINIKQIYEAYEEASYKKIEGLINQLDGTILPKDMFFTFMKRIYKRKK